MGSSMLPSSKVDFSCLDCLFGVFFLSLKCMSKSGLFLFLLRDSIIPLLSTGCRVYNRDTSFPTDSYLQLLIMDFLFELCKMCGVEK